MKILHGDRRDRINAAAPVPAARPVEAPEGLSKAAVAVWDQLAPDLVAKGVLTAWDVGIFGIFCDACARHRRAAEILDWEGVVVGDRINPAFTVWRTTALLVIKSGGRFGLSPADRQTLGLRAQSPTSDLLSS